jgi:hypothetical protein
VVRQSQVGMGVAMLTTFLSLTLTLTACESGEDSEAGTPSEATGTAVVQGKPLSEADLERAAVTAADLDGYEVNKILTATSASRRTADPAECGPVVQALGGSSGFTAVARVGRMIAATEEGDGSGAGAGASMILSSHRGEDAVAVIDELRTAAERCGSFEDISTDFAYEDTELQPDPDLDYGDESVSLRLTQVVADGGDEEPIRVPFTVLAVRQGTTVAMFYEFNRPGGSGEAAPAAIPEEIVRAQLDKLREPAAVG